MPFQALHHPCVLAWRPPELAEPGTDSPEAPLVGRAATAAAARPTRTAPPTHDANARGGAAAAAYPAPVGVRRRRRARVRGASGGSGPRRAAAAAGLSAAAAVPARILSAPFARTLRARTARVLDALLSGRGWIALIAVLLVGIVFFNVDLLQMNRDIAKNAERASALKRENARLRLDVARLASSERIQEAAAGLGLVLPAPGEVRYLKARPVLDARRAAKRITEPNSAFVPPAPVVTAPEPSVPPATTSTPPATTTTPPATTTTPPATTTAPPTTTSPPATTTAPPATTTAPPATTTAPPTTTTAPPATTTTPPTTTPPAGGTATPPAGTATGQTYPPTTGQTTP
jgi:cell division protein FtsL